MRLALVLIGWAGCGDPTDRVLARDGDPVSGSVVFGDHCAECHGSEGEGDVGPDLRDRDDTVDELVDKVLWGWGSMEGFVHVLSVREAADVVAFVAEEIQQPTGP